MTGCYVVTLENTPANTNRAIIEARMIIGENNVNQYDVFKKVFYDTGDQRDYQSITRSLLKHIHDYTMELQKKGLYVNSITMLQKSLGAIITASDDIVVANMRYECGRKTGPNVVEEDYIPEGNIYKGYY